MAWDLDRVREFHAKTNEAKAEILDNDSNMQRFFDSAVAWVIIPTIGNGGFDIGGQKFKVESKD